MKDTIKEYQKVINKTAEKKEELENTKSSSFYTKFSGEAERERDILKINNFILQLLDRKHQLLKTLEFELSQELNKTETEQIELKKIIN